MFISNATLINGRSHLNPNSKSGGIDLKTEEGLKFFAKKQKRFDDAVAHNAREGYRKFLEEELAGISHDLTFFLEDDYMYKAYNMGDRDEDGWHIYNTLMDKYNVCKYFIKRLK